MCGFGFTNKAIQGLRFVNEFAQRRGPDSTNLVQESGFSFFHNLLSITGDFTTEPFIDQDAGISCVYNGEIYNYKEFGGFNSDGQALIPVYKELGPTFCSMLDGEFAVVLVDFKKDLLIVSSDVFSTKPIWLAIEDDEVGIASYESVLTRLGFKSPAKIPANTILVYQLEKLQLKEAHTVCDFDLKQYKGTYEDWCLAFEISIRKRSENLREGTFLGLSSGYDSGAIACELTRQKVGFKAYSIGSTENTDILQSRLRLIETSELVQLTTSQYEQAQRHLVENAEKFYFGGYEVKNDPGAIGLSHICSLARREGFKIYLSGQGADEVISDYGFGGKKLIPESGFGGLFPEDLSTIFPYRNFFGGTQIKWIYKEESVAGSHGMEARYPFLDKALVQEFLWLKAELKNRKYKAPLSEYLERFGFPYEEGQKLGFFANNGLIYDRFIGTELIKILRCKQGGRRRRVKEVFTSKFNQYGNKIRK